MTRNRRVTKLRNELKRRQGSPRFAPPCTPSASSESVRALLRCRFAAEDVGRLLVAFEMRSMETESQGMGDGAGWTRVCVRGRVSV